MRSNHKKNNGQPIAIVIRHTSFPVVLLEMSVASCVGSAPRRGESTPIVAEPRDISASDITTAVSFAASEITAHCLVFAVAADFVGGGSHSSVHVIICNVNKTLIGV